MSRRPSYPAKLDEDTALSVSGLQSQRPSVGQSLGVDWSRSGNRGYAPLHPTYDAVEELDEKSYVELNLDGASIRPPRDVHSPFRHLQRKSRNTRLWERLAVVALTVCLLVLLLYPRRGGSVVDKAKLKLHIAKAPLKSTVPLHSYRANLLDNHGYLTTFPRSGYTNQVMEVLKLVHLAQRLNRDPIFPELKSVRGEGGDVPLSQFFDLESFSYNSNVSFIEWRDVKIPDIPGTQSERLSCWGWKDERPLARYNIHTDFWPPPPELTVTGGYETSMTFAQIEVLVSQPQDRWLADTASRFFGSVDNAPPFPDKQLLCFENLFFVPSIHFVEGEVDHSYSLEELSPEDPVWDKVGRHLHFSRRANEIADDLLRSLLGSTKSEFIGVHIRQGDFVELGRVPKALVETYSSAEAYIQNEVVARRKPGMFGLGGVSKRKLPVVFATDSDDPVFIKSLTALGWIHIDHTEFATVTRFGGWYPALLDSLIVSRSVGFVGAAVPPSWKDLGKSAGDLLGKDFPLSGNSLEVKTRAPNNVAFKVAGTRDSKSNLIAGDIESKYVDPKNGVTFTQTWTTANVLRTQVELENQIAKGLKFDIQGSLFPATQAKAATVNAIYKQPSLHTRALLDVFKGPTFTADAVVGRDGFLVGAETTYSVPTGSITRYAVGLGYATPSYAVTLHGLANLSVFSASYYHKVSPDVEAGAKAIWDSKSAASNVGIEVGGKAYLDPTAFVKAKINNSGIVALGYTQALRPGVKASFGLALDTQKLNEVSAAGTGVSAHKVGTSLTFEA